jgi:chitodextrinase
MKKLITATLLVACSVSFGQNVNSIWQTTSKSKRSTSKKTNSTSSYNEQLPLLHLFDLEVNNLNSKLASSPNRNVTSTSNTIISLPNGDGKLENFRVYENSVMDPALAAKYPEIKSYVAVGIDNPSARAYFSNSPLGFRSMILYADQSAVFIEPATKDLKTYTAYKKSDKKASIDAFECKTIDNAVNNIQSKTNNSISYRGADDGKLRTFRLALACTGEYAALFGGTKALALAGMNNTLTRINGVFEKDFGIKLILVANNDALVYTNSSTDPYSPPTSYTNWKTENQATLTSVIGEANYDIGHLFGSGVTNSGDAGATGSVCADNFKGRAYTCAHAGNYQGDSFDLDFVGHEFGHQLGANHTFSHANEGSIAQMEPGSGSTIMSYSGRTTKDIEFNSDAYFHAISIQQVTDLIKTKTCPVVISTGNAVPVVNAGLDYTIPKGTPFMLTGAATDANTNDVLTYNWEQMDLGTAATSVPSATNTAGPLFRSFPSSTSPVRYFPAMASVLSGATTTAGREIISEALPGVARTLNFRLTVRDNRVGGSANNADDVVITVDGNSGPFVVTSQNSTVSYAAGTTQTINWSVAGTNANGVNCATVDILLSTNGGATFPITLLSATPNNGSANVVIPNFAGTSNRIMVKGTNHIFFDVNNANFTITASGPSDTTAPTASTLTASGTTTSGTNLSWTAATDNVGVTGYDVYQNGVFKTTVTATSLAVSGLTASTAYSFYVRAKDAAGNQSVASNTVNVTTLTAADTTAPTASTLTASGTTTSGTNLSWTAATDNVGVTGYDVYQNGVFKTTVTATTLAVSGLSSSTTYNFYVKAKDAAGNQSVASNTVNVTTLANNGSLAHCSSTGTRTDKGYLNRVQLGSIGNVSGNNNGYGDYTALSTNLARGTGNTIVITPAWNGTAQSTGYCVWIDFNQDGDFDDSGELVFTKAKTKASSLTGNLIIPTTALTGTTRMRVSMKYNSLPSSCEIINFGEVEDYTVTITAGATLKNESTNAISASGVKDNDFKAAALTFKLYPNPVKDGIIYISDIDTNLSYRIFNMLGQEMAKGNLENKEINVDSLSNGTYIIELNDGTVSATKRFIKQ